MEWRPRISSTVSRFARSCRSIDAGTFALAFCALLVSRGSAAQYFPPQEVVVGEQGTFSCEPINRIPDYNCDGKLRIAVVGDSLVSGIGDSVNDNVGGYVTRVQKRLRYSEVLNFGIPGLRTRELLDRLVEAFDGSEEGDLHLGLLTADVIVLDIGRNDRWLYGTPKATYRNIKRAATMIRTRVAEETGMTPMVITAVLMLPNRGSQGPWVKELNDYILRGHRSTAPADLRFDLVSKRLLSADQIHPSSAGYDELARTLLKYLLRSLPPKMLALRPYADEHALH